MDENEEDYDIRHLKCGGWKSARISVKNSGRWSQFVDPDSHDTINKFLPIDPSRKYRPPKNIAIQSIQEPQRESKSVMPITSRSGLSNSNEASSYYTRQAPAVFSVPPIELTSDRLAYVHKDSQTRPKTESHTKLSEKQTPPVHENIFNFSSVKIPESSRIISKNRGEDPKRFPFRVSSIYLRDLAEAERRRREEPDFQISPSRLI